MAWNGSNGNTEKKASDGCKRPSHFNFKALAAGLIIAVLGAVAILWIVDRDGDRPSPVPGKEHNPQISIAAVTPQKPKKVEASQTSVQPKKVVNHPPTNQWGNPWHWGPNIKLRPAHTSCIDRTTLPLSYTLFEAQADREIAGLLEIEPGTTLLPCVEYGDDFVKSFLESLKTPVFVKHDDSEEAKAMKRAVIETKADLKARMDAGEDIAKIMNETRQELVQLGAYRDELRKMIAEKERDRTATREDMEDIVQAANRMLEERGLKKIVLPEFYYQQIQMRNERRKAREEAQK